MKSIGAAKFKARCLALLDQLDAEGLVITKHGRPVARVVPFSRPHGCLIGCLRDKIVIRGDILSTGVDWDADSQP